MTEAAQRPASRRILVALDGDESARAALDAAAGLAAALEAELVGLFVEDSDLMAAADLPLARSIPSHGRAGAPINSATMRRALRISAGKAGTAVAAVAERLRLKWSFRVIQGAIAEQVLAEARRCDVLALGSAGTIMRRARVEVAAGLMELPAPCSLLLMHARARPGRPVTVLYEGSARALELGRQLAEATGRRLVVVAAGADDAAAAGRLDQVAAWLLEHEISAEVHGLVADRADEICDALRGAYPGVLVVDSRGVMAGALPLDALLRQLACSVLVLK